MDRADYIAMVEDVYFGGMSRGDVAPIFALFTPDTTITTFYGATPFRRMRAEPGAGEEPLADFFTKAIDTFDVRYTDFQHVIDVEAERIWSIYTLHISAKPDGPMAGTPARKLRNCNFFELKAGKIFAVTAYFANPPEIPTR